MLMDPLTALSVGSSALSSIGSFASSLGIGGGEKRPRYRDALLAQKYATTNDFDARIESAKKHGINPLVALGVPATTGPAGHIGSSDSFGERMSAAGQGLGRAAAAIQSKEERESQRILTAQQIERGQLENDLLKSDIALKRGQLAPAIGSYQQNLTGVKAALADLKTPLGYADGALPLHQLTYDEKGNPIRVYNSNELGDSEVMTALHGAIYSVPDGIHGNIGRPAARWLADKVFKPIRRSWRSKSSRNPYRF